MAQKVQTLFIDDIDGGEAEGTVRFGLDGTDYEIDLSAAHSKELRKAAAKYIAAGRKVGGPARRRPSGGGRKNSGGGPTPSEVREWAKAKGIPVRDRGRVPTELVVRFQAASRA
jgi:hypothetical protein